MVFGAAGVVLPWIYTAVRDWLHNGDPDIGAAGSLRKERVGPLLLRWTKSTAVFSAVYLATALAHLPSFGFPSPFRFGRQRDAEARSTRGRRDPASAWWFACAMAVSFLARCRELRCFMPVRVPTTFDRRSGDDRVARMVAMALALSCSSAFGVLVEAILVRIRFFRHTSPDILGVPIWLPFLYLHAMPSLLLLRSLVRKAFF